SAIATADKCHFPLEFPAPAMALVFCLRPRSHLVLTSRLLRLCLFWLFFLFCWHMIQFLPGSRGIRPKRESQTCYAFRLTELIPGRFYRHDADIQWLTFLKLF